jgi:hypothetical protein
MYQIKSASLPTVDDVWARRAVLSLIMADVMTRRVTVRPTNIKSALAECEAACISLNILHPPIVSLCDEIGCTPVFYGIVFIS